MPSQSIFLTCHHLICQSACIKPFPNMHTPDGAPLWCCDGCSGSLSVRLAHIRDNAPQAQGTPWLQELLPYCVIPLALLQLDGEEVGEACVAPAAPQPAALQIHIRTQASMANTRTVWVGACRGFIACCDVQHTPNCAGNQANGVCEASSEIVTPSNTNRQAAQLHTP